MRDVLPPAARALYSLPTGATEADLLQALVRVAGQQLGCTCARVIRHEVGALVEVVAQWPPCKTDGAGPTAAWPLLEGLTLEVVGAEEAAALLAAAAGRLIEEARLRARLVVRIEDLNRRTRAAAELHRNLTLRLTELRGELDSTQQRQVVLHERNRIAQDLHDRAAQTNFLLALKLDWARARLPEQDPLRDELERLKELAAQASAQTREAIYALRASEMTDGGLIGGLRRLARELEGEGFTAELNVTGMPVPLTRQVEDALFMIAQEGLNNARKHSRGTAVILALRFAPAMVTLAVQDNGIGLPRAAPQPEAGRFGLTGMRERVTALGGDLRLLAGDEGGLIVRATIPIGEER